jgi:hypothetical protein
MALVTAVFLAIIAFPLLNGWFKLVPDIESTENRQMAVRPALELSHLDPFPSEYEKYYNENFSIRSLMVKSFNSMNIALFNKSPLPDKVVIGREGWLFMAETERESYQGINRFTQAEMETLSKELEYRKKYLEERGIRFYFMVAPMKAAIYPEYMPSTVYRINRQTWGEQLVEYLEEHCLIKPVNVYDVLRSEKGDELLDYKLDNHWNQLGAFYSAREFFRRLQEDGQSTAVPDIEDYVVSKETIYKGNIFKMISNTGNFRDVAYELAPKGGFRSREAKITGYPVIKGFPYPWEFEMAREIPGSAGPRMLMITDSYGANIFPFIAEGFSRTVKIFDDWWFRLNEDIVEGEQADVVLLIVLESNLRNLLKYKSLQTEPGPLPK